MRTTHTILFLASTLVLAACQRQEPPTETETAPAASVAEHAEHAPDTTPGEAATGPVLAKATLAPTQGSEVKGEIDFIQLASGLHASGKLSGLKPNSEHGFHIHEKGDCSAPDGSSAGGHFNPAKTDHGNVSSDPHHGGDMPNIVADAEGNATVDGPVSSNVNAGKGDDFDIIGKGLIVHADPDDYATQPTGNAGGRLACAVISAP
ncbi:superoxide dismutase family protein [Stenotrophomonas sp. MMGLT7]|uniref:superoxide dismutase family protein n=1 Tax=Stenotrophomonas sp. MMGLT7 TaxID=2901227 RepID=UPI001E5894D1|nr:superoxide dismutase family protein [Stenotrophomonas sp. MMGLT7]MCD7099902.1 superoxide dismutase family protein [Stenotrophomonas sp. MMGLT7]